MVLYIENQEKRDKERFKLKIIIFILGISSIIGWFFHLFQIFNAIFYDKSSLLQFSEAYGIIIISYNLHGEMILEAILFLIVFISLSLLTLYTLKKRWG